MSKKILITITVIFLVISFIVVGIVIGDNESISDKDYTIASFEDNSAVFDVVAEYLYDNPNNIACTVDDKKLIIKEWDENYNYTELIITDSNVVFAISYILLELDYYSISKYDNTIYFEHQRISPVTDENVTPSMQVHGVVYCRDDEKMQDLRYSYLVNNWYYYSHGYV